MMSIRTIKRILGVIWRNVKCIPGALGKLGSIALQQIKNPSLIVLISTPTHHNLGDQAIVFAETQFLADMGFKEIMIEITKDQYSLTKHVLQRLVRPNDVIVIDGGGNVGTLWPQVNNNMIDIVMRFKNNKIVVFPQTAFFSETEEGECCKREVYDAYGNSKNILFFCRDNRTYQLMKKLLPELHCKWAPDIVLYLSKRIDARRNNVALLCLRPDKERVLSDSAGNMFIEYFKKRNVLVKRTSMLYRNNRVIISRSNRLGILEKKWDEFRSARIVVTDRLHGMIFSAITGTPCIALDNSSKKVSGVYEWIKTCPYIRMADSLPSALSMVDDLLTDETASVASIDLSQPFETMKEDIREFLQS